MQSVKIINDHTIQRQSYIGFFVNNPISYENFIHKKTLRKKIEELNANNSFSNAFREFLFDYLRTNYTPNSFITDTKKDDYGYSCADFTDRITNGMHNTISELIESSDKRYVKKIDSLISKSISTKEDEGIEEIDQIMNNQSFYLSEYDGILNYFFGLLIANKVNNIMFGLDESGKFFSYSKLKYISEFYLNKKTQYNKSLKSLSKNITIQLSEKSEYRKEYLLYLLLSSEDNLYLVINPLSNDCNIVDSYNLHKFFPGIPFIISLGNWNIFLQYFVSKTEFENHNSLRKIYAKFDDESIVLKLKSYLFDIQIKSFECEKKESHYILKPTYLKYQGEQLPDKVIKDTEKFGGKQEIKHREEKRIYYTPTYKLPRVAKTEGKNIDSN